MCCSFFHITGASRAFLRALADDIWSMRLEKPQPCKHVELQVHFLPTATIPKKEDLAQEMPWATISKTLQELRTVFIKSFYYRKQLYIKCVFLLFNFSRFHYEVSLSLPLSLLLDASLAFFLPRNCRGVRFHFWILLIIEYVCMSVCLSVCVCHQKTPHQRYMHNG